MSELCLLCPAWGGLARNRASDPASGRAAGPGAAEHASTQEAAMPDAETHLSDGSIDPREERLLWLGLGTLASMAIA